MAERKENRLSSVGVTRSFWQGNKACRFPINIGAIHGPTAEIVRILCQVGFPKIPGWFFATGVMIAAIGYRRRMQPSLKREWALAEPGNRKFLPKRDPEMRIHF